jgi:enhancing lycopene biosynthesis protein 2
METKKFAVILSGCGVYDGAEIHEAVMTFYAIVKNHCTYEVFAPDIEQFHVINHLSGEVSNEKRNVLIESARISRGKIKSLSEFDANEFDALVIPGGFGVAKNLCDFAFKGAEMTVLPIVEKTILEMHKMKKPIGALCISPVLLAKVIQNTQLTIGNDQATAQNIETLGAEHVETSHGEVVIDRTNNLYTTPCYMLDANIKDIAIGAENIILAILENF